MKNNKIIAEFMGLRIVEGYLQRNISIEEGLKFPNGDKIQGWQVISHESKIMYHASFDSLLPVYDKIFKIAEIIGFQYEDEVLKHYKEIHMSLLRVDINNTYEKIVNFINWFNGLPKQVLELVKKRIEGIKSK